MEKKKMQAKNVKRDANTLAKVRSLPVKLLYEPQPNLSGASEDVAPKKQKA